MTEWQADGIAATMASVLELDSVPFGWLGRWRERIERAGASLQVYRVPTLTGSPLFACEINDLDKDSRVYRAVQGRGCHALPEIALFKALAEALQARVTLIAGSRDDQLPSAYSRRAPGIVMAFGLPLPPGAASVAWDDIAPGPSDPEQVAETLARKGYSQVAVLELARPRGLTVARIFVCGLGSMRRRRRPPRR